MFSLKMHGLIKSMPLRNKNFKYLLCAMDVFTKYTWVKPLKDEKGKLAFNAFTETANESNRKPNKLWIDQGRDNKDILMYSTHNEGKSVIAESFIKTLKATIYLKKLQLTTANLIFLIQIN